MISQEYFSNGWSRLTLYSRLDHYVVAGFLGNTHVYLCFRRKRDARSAIAKGKRVAMELTHDIRLIANMPDGIYNT
jgi:hypothetical protein